jgi:predicted secreted protein
MATTLGREGTLTFDSGTVAEIRSFKLTETQSSYDKNVMGGGEWDQSVGGRKAWNVEVECFYDPDDAQHGGIAIGDEATGEFFPEGDTSGNERRHGTCRVEERTVTASEDGLVELSLKLKGTGTLSDAAVA